jgi:hypothetical protein
MASRPRALTSMIHSALLRDDTDNKCILKRRRFDANVAALEEIGWLRSMFLVEACRCANRFSFYL